MPVYPFLESHVRGLYRLLAHGDSHSDLRCVDVNQGKMVDRSIVRGEEDVVRWAREFNGKGNCFIGRNPRNADGSVSRVTTATIDIDPVRPKGTSADDAMLSLALRAGRDVVTAYPHGYLGCSGNGALVVFALEESDDVSKKLKAFEELLRKRMPDGVRIDSTHDDARMIKMLGTVSMKGEVRRVSRFLDLPVLPYRRGTLPDIEHRAAEKNARICSEIPNSSRLRMLEKAIQELSPARCDDYDTWVKVGIACKEFGAAGFKLWDEWSKTSSKYSAGETEKKWRSFDDEPKITVGSVVHWAREDGGRANSGQPDQSKPVHRLTVFTPNGNLLGHRERLLHKAQHPRPEISLGLPILDGHTWGLHRGEIYTIAARTGVGKTSFAACVIKNNLLAGKRVLIFSTETSVDNIINRLLSSYTGVSGNAFRTGVFSEDDRKRLDDGYKWLENVGNRFMACDASGPSLAAVRLLAETLNPDLLVFDHIQRIGGGTDARYAISEFVRGLKNIARDTNCAVLALSQLRRMFRDYKTGLMPPPQLSDLKESGTIEEESGQVLLLSEYSTGTDTSGSILIGELAKNRYGEPARVAIEFDRATARFNENVNVALSEVV
jgi:KaiC/GvpD/RAD55 family RecA-like ATPase